MVIDRIGGTGAVKAGPADKNIDTFTVREQGGEVFLEL